jgi:hypothetical protein
MVSSGEQDELRRLREENARLKDLLACHGIARDDPITNAGLNAEESTLFDQLRQNHWGDRVRLEQEMIGFSA